MEKQQKQNSLEEGKLRQTGCSESKILTNLGGKWPWAERGKGGDDTLEEKMQPKEFFWSHASLPVFSGATIETHAWMAMEHSWTGL